MAYVLQLEGHRSDLDMEKAQLVLGSPTEDNIFQFSYEDGPKKEDAVDFLKATHFELSPLNKLNAWD